MPKFSITTKGAYLKIFIDGVVHVCIEQKKIVGFQSWKSGNGWYCIEFYTSKKSILLEYDNIAKWKSILDLLNKTI